MDKGTRRAWVGEREVELSIKEFELLAVLAAEPERVHTEELLRAVWGLGSWARTRTLDSHAFRLRQKLRNAGAGGLVGASETVGSYLDRRGVQHDVQVRWVEAHTWEIVDVPERGDEVVIERLSGELESRATAAAAAQDYLSQTLGRTA